MKQWYVGGIVGIVVIVIVVMVLGKKEKKKDYYNLESDIITNKYL